MSRSWKRLFLSHYEGESQTLTSGAEANLLKFKELVNKMSAEEAKRWEEIKGIFRKGQQAKAFGGNNMAQLLVQIENVSHALYGIRSALADKPFYPLNEGGLAPGGLEEGKELI